MPIEPARKYRGALARELGDDEIVAAVRRGDSSVAQSLYDLLQPAIEYALRRVLRYRCADEDDLVQTTFERVVRAIAADRFSGRSALTTWAAAIAGHVAIDYLRRSQFERRLFRDVSPVGAPARPSGTYSTEGALVARSEIQRIQGVLSRMSPLLAETVVLHDVLGYSIEEVATITGVSGPAARSRLLRGRKDLVRRAAAWKTTK